MTEFNQELLGTLLFELPNPGWRIWLVVPWGSRNVIQRSSQVWVHPLFTSTVSLGEWYGLDNLLKQPHLSPEEWV